MLRLPIEGLDSRWQMLALSWIWAPRSSSLILLAGGIRLIVPNKDNSRLLSPKKIYVNARCIHAIDTGVCAVSKGFIETQQGCLEAPLCKLPLPPNLPTLRKGDAPASSFLGPGGYQQQHKGFWSFKLQNASQKPYSPVASGLPRAVL